MRLTKPFTGDEELAEVRAVLESGYLTQGPVTARFEEAVCSRIGAKHGFAMSSCTTALHLALVALGVGRGDEVLVSDFTFPASANVVIQQQARPILVDVDLPNFTMSPADLAAKWSDRTTAVIVVHAFGSSADMDPIMTLARERGVPVIEDAATAIGTTYRGQHSGTIGDIGCFSFHARKVITTGEGGMIVTDSDELADKIRVLRSHGSVSGELWPTFEEAGFNYRMSDIAGAVGIAQMRRLEWIITERRRLTGILSKMIADLPGITVPTQPEWGGHIFQSYVVLLDDNIDRDVIVRRLRSNGVESTLGTYALHAEPFFQRSIGHQPGDLANSMLAASQGLTLPLYPGMSPSDLSYVANALITAASD